MNYDKLLNLGADLGRRLMSSGAEIHRVEESVSRLLTAYGLEPQVFAIPATLIVSVTTPDGHPITRMCRVPVRGTDIELLERCNALCRRLCREVPDVDEAQRLVDELGTGGQMFPRSVVLMGYVAAAAFFALFFGGGALDALCAALCGLATGGCLLFGQRLTGSNVFLRTVICSAILSALAWLLGGYVPGVHTDTVTIGALMLLVPGMALTNAMREIMAGDILSGLQRTAEVILVATAIALGTAVPLVLGRLM